VFGTSCPPRGLSGALRGLGYRYSEGRMARWLLLMTADRVDTVEGIFVDLFTLRGPHLAREMGWRSEWRHNRAGFLGKAALVILVLAVIVVVATT